MATIPTPRLLLEIMAEVNKATLKFPTWPQDPLHAMGVLNEEVGELNKAVLQEIYEPHKNKNGDVRKEAIQAAAMAVRFLMSLDAEQYRFSPGRQITQTRLE